MHVYVSICQQRARVIVVCDHNLRQVNLLILSLFQNENKKTIKTIPLIHVLEVIKVYQAFQKSKNVKILGFFIFFSKVYKVCNDMCNIYVL